ncbi:major capsid protein, partial [Bordetella bronchiseptica]
RAFIEGMNQTQATTLFYGDSSIDAEKFMGLTPRFNSLSAENGQNIIDAGGTGSDNASIWLTVWGPNTLHTIYPKGSQAGLQSRDLGEDTLIDAAGGRYQGYRTHYKWDIGLTLRDWRYVVRIANVDVSELTKNASAGADLIDLMTQA